MAGGYGGFPRMEDRVASGPAPPFPRMEDRVASGPAPDEVTLRISERAKAQQHGTQIQTTSGGETEIAMVPYATTTGYTIKRATLEKSPVLRRCLSGIDCVAGCPIAGDEMGLDDQTRDSIKLSYKGSNGIELEIFGRQNLITSASLLQCIDLCAEDALPFSAEACTTGKLFTMFACAAILELDELANVCRREMSKDVSLNTVALVLWIAHRFSDDELLRRCYWFLKDLICSARVPSAWLDDSNCPVKLCRGFLSHRLVCKTPLRALSSVVDKDYEEKLRRWMTATQGYTLCQLHRRRGPEGGYPHIYELKFDHSSERFLTALKADEQARTGIFSCDADINTSEFCEEFLGSVRPNFWGTSFQLYDCGQNLDKLRHASPCAKDFPLRGRSELCRIGFETNLLGECPRKITLDFTRDGEKCHYENVAPRWDPKLNSYALPFFGRVKLASAKNFQLVENGDHNSIFLMFGKIQKDIFCLDFRHPITPLDAMAVATAALAKKRAVS